MDKIKSFFAQTVRYIKNRLYRWFKEDQYQDGIIREVTEYEDGYEIKWSKAWLMYLKKEHGVAPHPGQVIRIYGEGMTIRGVDIGTMITGRKIKWQEAFYRTPEEQRHLFAKKAKQMDEQSKKDFKQKKEKLDEDYNSLPEIFQRRIDKFRRNNPDFRWKYESYEMGVCTEAVKVAEAMKTPEKVQEFAELPYKKQKELVDIDEGHSGLSFGMVLRLAYLYLDNPEAVEKMHGALAPLVGSEEYGCVLRPNHKYPQEQQS